MEAVSKDYIVFDLDSSGLDDIWWESVRRVARNPPSHAEWMMCRIAAQKELIAHLCGEVSGHFFRPDDTKKSEDVQLDYSADSGSVTSRRRRRRRKGKSPVDDSVEKGSVCEEGSVEEETRDIGVVSNVNSNGNRGDGELESLESVKPRPGKKEKEKEKDKHTKVVPRVDEEELRRRAEEAERGRKQRERERAKRRKAEDRKKQEMILQEAAEFRRKEQERIAAGERAQREERERERLQRELEKEEEKRIAEERKEEEREREEERLRLEQLEREALEFERMQREEERGAKWREEKEEKRKKQMERRAAALERAALEQQYVQQVPSHSHSHSVTSDGQYHAYPHVPPPYGMGGHQFHHHHHPAVPFHPSSHFMFTPPSPAASSYHHQGVLPSVTMSSGLSLDSKTPSLSLSSSSIQSIDDGTFEDHVDSRLRSGMVGADDERQTHIQQQMKHVMEAASHSSWELGSASLGDMPMRTVPMSSPMTGTGPSLSPRQMHHHHHMHHHAAHQQPLHLPHHAHFSLPQPHPQHTVRPSALPGLRHSQPSLSPEYMSPESSRTMPYHHPSMAFTSASDMPSDFSTTVSPFGTSSFGDGRPSSQEMGMADGSHDVETGDVSRGKERRSGDGVVAHFESWGNSPPQPHSVLEGRISDFGPSELSDSDFGVSGTIPASAGFGSMLPSVSVHEDTHRRESGTSLAPSSTSASASASTQRDQMLGASSTWVPPRFGMFTDGERELSHDSSSIRTIGSVHLPEHAVPSHSISGHPLASSSFLSGFPFGTPPDMSDMGDVIGSGGGISGSTTEGTGERTSLPQLDELSLGDIPRYPYGGEIGASSFPFSSMRDDETMLKRKGGDGGGSGSGWK